MFKLYTQNHPQSTDAIPISPFAHRNKKNTLGKAYQFINHRRMPNHNPQQTDQFSYVVNYIYDYT